MARKPTRKAAPSRKKSRKKTSKKAARRPARPAAKARPKAKKMATKRVKPARRASAKARGAKPPKAKPRTTKKAARPAARRRQAVARAKARRRPVKAKTRTRPTARPKARAKTPPKARPKITAPAKKAAPIRPRVTPPVMPLDTTKGKAPRTKPRSDKPAILGRERRLLSDVERLPSADDRMLSSVKAGGDEMRADRRRHTETSPELTAGDVDAKWQDAYAEGDESPGGDNPTPDQNRVDLIGKALGVEYEDDEELEGGEELAERDEHRWELDSDSKDDE